MARGKLPPIFTPNTLESMIEYTLISNLLDSICETTTKPWECQKDDNWLFPFQHLFKIRTCGIEWKRSIDKKNEWATWRWTNAKIDKESLIILKQIVKLPKEDMENYHQAMFTYTMDFFKECTILKKSIPKHFSEVYSTICQQRI